MLNIWMGEPPAGMPCKAGPALFAVSCGCMRVGHRFVVLLSNDHDYFFVLYIVYFVAQGWLALLALAHYPGEQDLDPLPENISLIVYEVLCPLTKMGLQLLAPAPCSLSSSQMSRSMTPPLSLGPFRAQSGHWCHCVGRCLHGSTAMPPCTSSACLPANLVAPWDWLLDLHHHSQAVSLHCQSAEQTGRIGEEALVLHCSSLSEECQGDMDLRCAGLQELAGDNRPNEELVCPEATASLWSTITFSWVSDLMKKGYKCAPL